MDMPGSDSSREGQAWLAARAAPRADRRSTTHTLKYRLASKNGRLLRNRPRQDRDRCYGILRTAFDDAVAVDQVNQRIASLVEEAHDLHGFEDQRGALLEHHLAVLQLFIDANRPYLTTGDGSFSSIFGLPQPALDASRLGAREITGHPFDFRVIERLDHDLVIWPEPLEYRIDGADFFSGRQTRQSHTQYQRQGHRTHGKHLRRE